MGHELEDPISFLGGLISIPLSILLATLATHAIGWVWNVPARLLHLLTVEGVMSIVPMATLITGFSHLLAGGPSKRLASGYLSITLGGGLMVLMTIQSMTLATAGPAGQTGMIFNPLCLTPDQKYYTDRSSERVYRFFFPYGLFDSFVGNCMN